MSLLRSDTVRIEKIRSKHQLEEKKLELDAKAENEKRDDKSFFYIYDYHVFDYIIVLFVANNTNTMTKLLILIRRNTLTGCSFLLQRKGEKNNDYKNIRIRRLRWKHEKRGT